MSMHKDDYAAKGKQLFGNFADDWKENLIIAAICIALGRFGFPWIF